MMPAPSYDLRWRAIFAEGQMLFEILYAGQMRILLPLFIELLISILSLITIYCGSIWLNAMFTSLHLKLFRSRYYLLRFAKVSCFKISVYIDMQVKGFKSASGRTRLTNMEKYFNLVRYKVFWIVILSSLCLSYISHLKDVQSVMACYI